MKTFALVDGDFALAPGGYKLVTGSPKMLQDLSIALREPFGTDRFNPRWGSLLPSYVGQPIDTMQHAFVKAEIERVITNYMAVQQALLQRDATAGRRPRFASGEIVRAVEDVTIAQEYDRINVVVTLTTLDNQEVTVAVGV